MSRALAAALQVAISQASVRPALLADVGLNGYTLFVWTGVGTLTWNGHDYQGIGSFGGASGTGEKLDLAATNVLLQLSGIPSANLSAVLQDVRVNGTATLYLACLDVNTRELVVDPVIVFAGYTDVPTIQEGPETSTISLAVESRLRALERPRVRQYTPEDQAIDHPGDRGFDFVASLQDLQITWA